MARPSLPLLLVASLLGSSLQLPAARAQAPDRLPATAETVASAIDRGIQFLKRQQQDDGTWPEQALYGGGLTPLCTLALLTAGVPVDDPTIVRALDYLRKFKANATYTTSLQTMVFCAADPVKDRHLIVRNVRWLETRQIENGDSAGMWAKPATRTPDHIDNSMTHLAMLALYEAERVGVPASDATWRRSLDFWQRIQNADGSWGWGPGYPGTGSMTSAGIASILAASSILEPGDALAHGDRIDCCQEPTDNPHIQRGLAWLQRNFSVVHNPGTQFWLTYYLFSLERVGRMTAQRLIGDHDWYREGAEVLVNLQRTLGDWPSDIDEEHLQDPNVSTSFALMFLAKARRPVLWANLDRPPAADWNRHRHAMGNLTHYVERAWHRDLTHQIIHLENAQVEDLLLAPVLFISGREALDLTPEQKQHLRDYVDRGGFLFASASCSGGEFDRSFRSLMQEIFPESSSALRLLPVDHPIWFAEEKIDPTYLGELWGIDVGCRTGVIYSPQDLACHWELGGLGRARHTPEVRAQIQAAQSIGLNVLSYATGRQVEFKSPGRPNSDSAPAELPARGALTFANILHPGGCREAPAALANFLRHARQQLHLRTVEQPAELLLTAPELFAQHWIVMHGRSAFQLTPAERQALRQYLERGGTLFADAVCSSREFAASFRQEINSLFPDLRLEPIPYTHPIFSSRFGGSDIELVERRRPPGTARNPAAPAQKEHPQLEGLLLDDRFAVIFSPYDISCALDSPAAPGCEGYVHQDAVRIMLNLLLYSLHE
jgi:hypothetical protein